MKIPGQANVYIINIHEGAQCLLEIEEAKSNDIM